MDVTRYSEAMDRFLVSMETVRDLDSPDVAAAMTGLCRVLRIARVNTIFYETPMDRNMGSGKFKIFYDDGNADEDKELVITNMTDMGNPVEYRYCPIKGDVKWDTDEVGRIHVFAKVLHTFCGRVRTMRYAEDFMFKDRELNIYNLAYFFKRAGQLISKGEIGAYESCFYNLQRLSSINLSIGRERATGLMGEYAKMLQEKIGKEGCVCRVGGDNFVALFKKEKLDEVQDHLLGVHMTSDEHTGEAIVVSAYGGFYDIPDECKVPTQIMDNMSVALRQAKLQKLHPQVFFDEHLVKMQEHKKMIENLFPIALEREEFLVYYQPKMNIKTEVMAGAEALCRWKHEGEMMPPGNFIPILEQTMNVCRLDFYMLEHVCRDVRRWLDEGRPVVRVSVNLSRRHLGSTNLLENVLSIVDRNHVPHEYIEIELTETTTDVDFTDLKEIVSGLSAEGISTSVDDFGVGYSSMNLLRDLPWNVIKIDRSFLPEDVKEEPKQYKIFTHLIAMAKDLGLECIVEGVETKDQVKMLSDNNCFLAQGFYYDRPLPVHDFEKRLEKLESL